MELKKTLIPLAALAVLGAGCSGAQAVEPEEEVAETMAPRDYIYDTYLSKATLEYEAESDGELIQMYEEERKDNRYLRVVMSDGTTIDYADIHYEYAPFYNLRLDWVAIPENGEIRLYKEDTITIIKDGKETELPPREDMGTLALKIAQKQFDDYMAVIDEYEEEQERVREQQEEEYYETTLKPLQDWALEMLGSEALPELPEWMLERYIIPAELVFDEVLDGERVRMYEKAVARDRAQTIILVDRPDGTSSFYEDWIGVRRLATVAFTQDGVTTFFESDIMRLFRDGEQIKKGEWGIGDPAIAEAQPHYIAYLREIYSSIGSYRERNP